MYPDSNSSSQKMYDRALASLPGGNTRTTVFMKPYPIYAARGEGCRVWDLDGNVYIDCINNFTSQIHGHAHPALIKAATSQLALGSAFGLPTESEVDLAELLVVCARTRNESRGGHFREDYPNRDDVNFMRHTMAYREVGDDGTESIRLDYKPVVQTRYQPMERKY